MSKSYPHVFQDTDKWSETFGQWCIRWSDSYNIDGYPTRWEALKDLWLKQTNKEIREGKNV